MTLAMIRTKVQCAVSPATIGGLAVSKMFSIIDCIHLSVARHQYQFQ